MPRHPLRSRRGWLVTAAVVVALVAGGAVLVTSRQAAPDGCEAAVPEADRGGLPSVITPPDLAAAIPSNAGTPLFGQPRYAVRVPPPGAVRLAGDALLVDRERDSLWALDAGTGQTRWLREPHGAGPADVWLGDRVAFVRQPADQPLTVATVDPASGDLRSCDQLGESTGQAPAAVVAPTGDGALALLREAAGERVLSLVDPGQPEPVRWERPVDLPELPGELRQVAGVVVASHAPDDDLAAWELAADSRRVPPADRLSLRAFSLADGAPAWEYVSPVDDGGHPYLHRIVGQAGDLLAVLAMRLDGTGDILEHHLVGLDAAAGEPRWTRPLPPIGATRAPEARLYGDTVLARERAAQDELVGYDLTTGEERWRIPNPVSRLTDGTRLPGTDSALLPAISRAGLVEVNLSSGETDAAFDGVSVAHVVATDAVIGVTFLLDGAPTLVLYDRSRT